MTAERLMRNPRSRDKHELTHRPALHAECGFARGAKWLAGVGEIRRAREPQRESRDGLDGQGLHQHRLWHHDAFWKSGAGGFALIVVPSLDLVIYKMGGSNGQYDSNFTDIPQPEPNHDRDDWKPHPRHALNRRQPRRR
jgi:hypothetical protein